MNKNDCACFRHSSVVRIPAAILAFVLLTCSAALGRETTDRVAKAQAAILAPREYAFRSLRVRDAINQVAGVIRLNVVYHISSLSAVDRLISALDLHQLSAPDAIEVLLNTNGLAQFQIDRRAIMIVDQNHSHGPVTSIQSMMAKAIEEEQRDALHGDNRPLRLRPRDVTFIMELASTIESLAKSAGLKVLFDKTIDFSTRYARLEFDIKDVTIAQALKYVLEAYDLKYEEVTGDTINIVDENHQHSSTPLEEIIKKLK
jgi:hypothetical protein